MGCSVYTYLIPSKNSYNDQKSKRSLTILSEKQIISRTIFKNICKLISIYYDLEFLIFSYYLQTDSFGQVNCNIISTIIKLINTILQ